MKNNQNIIYIRILSLLIFSFWFLPVSASEQLIEFSGYIKNIKNKKPIDNVSLTVEGTNIGTVTNDDGYFSLKVPANSLPTVLKAEYIGFQTITIPLSLKSNRSKIVNLFMTPTGKVLKELFVLGGDPKEIVEAALKKIPENYSANDNLFSGFYRETVKKGNRYINISEALVDVLKKPYKHRNTFGEKVKIDRGRKLLSPKPSDTIAVKLMGGPYMPIVLDAVKNDEHLFSIDEIENYEFKMEPGALIDDRMHYAISFKPIVTMPYPLYSGVFYIDGDNLTISRVEFELDMKDKKKVTNSILQKKPSGLNFKPIEVSGVVTYKTINGKSYLDYINSKMRFKCDWKKRLFSSTYTSQAEMVMTSRTDSIDRHMKFNDTFGSRKIFSDQVDNYWDENFWKDYNIIEPSESLEKAVNKLRKK